MLLDVAIALEEVNDREIRRRLAIRHGGTLQDRPPLHAVRVDELVDEPGLAYPGLPDQRHDLTMPCPGALQRLLQGQQLRLPSHEAREPPCGTGLQAPTESTGPDQLTHLHRLGQPFNR